MVRRRVITVVWTKRRVTTFLLCGPNTRDHKLDEHATSTPTSKIMKLLLVAALAAGATAQFGRKKQDAADLLRDELAAEETMRATQDAMAGGSPTPLLGFACHIRCRLRVRNFNRRASLSTPTVERLANPHRRCARL
eukprot:3454773-Prymnesium_polylepis.2